LPKLPRIGGANFWTRTAIYPYFEPQPLALAAEPTHAVKVPAGLNELW